MRYFIILALFCLVGWASSRKCPAKYRRFSPQHSLCLPPNPTCKIMRKGVTPEDKEYILRLHNQFRSKTAMGNEDRAKDGTLPQAADMMQLEWDDELASVAQKWTENCKYEHDCDACREVENFHVGQNIGKENVHCSGDGCNSPVNDPNWTWVVTAFYDEVKDYYVKWLDSFKVHSGPKIVHLTQMIWSRTWRVGCGYSFYKQGDIHRRYYACDYGIAGNMAGEPVYKQGPPCSACPTNSQCSTSSSGPNSYPGLCKMIDPNTAPVYARDESLLFYCSASANDPDCQHEVSGGGAWRTVQSIGGNYYSVVLKGGQSATITFNKLVNPQGGVSCLYLYIRKGPLKASRKDDSSLQTKFEIGSGPSTPMELGTQSTTFTNIYYDLPWKDTTKLIFTFSVPKGAGKHILDIRKLKVFKGPCP